MKEQDRDSTSARLLSFLDQAYEAPFDPENFDEVIAAAATYLTDGAGQAAPAQHIQQDAHDALIAPHSDRLQMLLDLQETRNRTTPAVVVRDRLVGLVISTEGLCVGNSNAADLFDVQFPVRLDALGLSAEARGILDRLLADARDKLALHSDVAILELADGRRFVSRFSQHQSHDHRTGETTIGIAVTVVHVAWSAETLDLARRTFGLTESEASVLGGYLEGLSQSEIAEARGRSVETVKSQSKSILAKSGCDRMTDLIGLMMNIALFSEPVSAAKDLSLAGVQDLPTGDLRRLPDGSEVAVQVVGRRGGTPVLFVHGLLNGPYFSADLLRGFAARDIHLVAPSRPGFGHSSQIEDPSEFDETVVRQAVQIAALEFERPPLVIAHQGGGSHACRIAAALGPGGARGLLMISAGIPIDDHKHLGHMNVQTRVGAIAARYAPSVLAMLLRIGINQFNRKGHGAYLRQYFKDCPADLAALEDEEILELYRRSVHHMTAQGPQTFINDGRAAMAEWGADYDAVGCPVRWLHGEADPIIPPHVIEEWAAVRGHGPVDVVEGAGNALLWKHPGRVLAAIDAMIGKDAQP